MSEGNDAGSRPTLTASTTPEELRATFLFEAFSDEQLGWVLEHAAVEALAAGTPLLTEGQPSDDLWVLLEGQLQISRDVGGREVILETSEAPGTWAGWLPMFDDASPLTCRLLRPSRLLRFGKEEVRQMLAGFPIATHLLAGVTWGMRNFEAAARQQEKLAALGKLSAGLAHELNNPAAAAGRAAGRLREALRERDDRALALGRQLDAEQAAALAELAGEAVARAASVQALDPLARSDREEALAAWLEDRGVADAADLAATLADADLDMADLERVAERLRDASVPDALAWLGATVALGDLALQIEHSVARISDLVGAVKGYSYMDRAAVPQETDLREGLENTLKILAYRLRGVAVERRYDPDLPRVLAVGSDLNQVWTNLLDNAIDAVEAAPAGQGRIVIRTAREDDGVVVEIADNGVGIPPAIQGRIFEPFFTTKGVGEGTGLGLDSSYRIVVRQHRGDIGVTSEPGDTRVRVWLPTSRQASAVGSRPAADNPAEVA